MSPVFSRIRDCQPMIVVSSGWDWPISHLNTFVPQPTKTLAKTCYDHPERTHESVPCVSKFLTLWPGSTYNLRHQFQGHLVMASRQRCCDETSANMPGMTACVNLAWLDQCLDFLDLFGMNGGKKRTLRVIRFETRCCNNYLNWYHSTNPCFGNREMRERSAPRRVVLSRPIGSTKSISCRRISTLQLGARGRWCREVMVDFTHGCLGWYFCVPSWSASEMQNQMCISLVGTRLIGETISHGTSMISSFCGSNIWSNIPPWTWRLTQLRSMSKH